MSKVNFYDLEEVFEDAVTAILSGDKRAALALLDEAARTGPEHVNPSALNFAFASSLSREDIRATEKCAEHLIEEARSLLRDGELVRAAERIGRFLRPTFASLDDCAERYAAAMGRAAPADSLPLAAE